MAPKVVIRRTGQGGCYGESMSLEDDIRSEIREEIEEAIYTHDSDGGEIEVGDQRYRWFISATKIRCGACGESVLESEMADRDRHATGGETICLRCHREVIESDSDLVCAGCGHGNRG